MDFLSNSQENIVSIVIGYPTLNLTAGENSENIESGMWPDPNVSDPRAVRTFAPIKNNMCYMIGRSEDFRFIQKSSKTHRLKHSLKHKQIGKHILDRRHKALELSFVQGNSAYYQMWFSGTEPLYYYAPSELELSRLNMSEGTDDIIDLTMAVGSTNTQKLGDGFTILLGFDLEGFPDKQDFSTIFSNSDNGCYQFIINDMNNKNKDKTFQFRKTGETGNKNTF